MAEQSGGLLSGIREGLNNNPATQRLLDEAQGYVQARARSAVRATTDKVGGLSERLTEAAENGGSAPLRKGAEKLAEGKSPMSAAASAGLAKVGEKVKGMFGGGSSSGSKTVGIMEQIDVGVARSVAYNQWTQFQDFAKFTKGVQSADQEDETHVQWRAKIAFSTRSWKSTITEQVPDERIAWKSEGDKGSVDGVVTFHELAPNLTRVLLDLEYHPAGFFEKTGNLWRAQGRRARLDLKKFRQFLMGEGEETGAWRGEVRDGEVVNRGDEGDGKRKKRRDNGRRSSESGNGNSKRASAGSGRSSNGGSSGNGSNGGGKRASSSSKPASGNGRKSAAASKQSPSKQSASKQAPSKQSQSKQTPSKPSASKRSTSASSSSRGTTTKSSGRSTPKKTASRSTSSGSRTRAKAGAGSK